jgi:hypothetical protein
MEQENQNSSDEETKKCPFCWEEVKAIAKKCKHCWESLDEKDRIPEKKMPISLWWVKPQIRCKKCGYEWKAKYYQKWNALITIILFLCFIIPWIIYMIWRGKPYWVCPNCWNDLLQKLK